MKRGLRHGYTTGACAAAAAKGAALMLAQQEQVADVIIGLPAGLSATFALNGQTFDNESASCYVVKDAGDDPDVTNGAEVHARVWFLPGENNAAVRIAGGIGIGKATKPGLAVAPGEWAINPVPRRMIAEAVGEAFPSHAARRALKVEISIPDGEERARRTLNARLGIAGGLSILGTTGIVHPISAKAWTDTIDAALDVAKACGCRTVVLSTGRTSEMAAQKHLASSLLPEEAFIMMGDHIAHAMRSCLSRGFRQPLIACQFAKLLKIACGHENTHAAASELDLRSLSRWAKDARLPDPIIDDIRTANTAREIIIATKYDPMLLSAVLSQASIAIRRHASGLTPIFLPCNYEGGVLHRD